MIDKFKFKNKNTDGDHSHKIKRETRTYLHIREDMSINSVGQFGQAEGTESSGNHVLEPENQN